MDLIGDSYFMDLICDVLSSLLIVDAVCVDQVAKWLKVGLLLQQRDEVVRITAESLRDDFTDLSLHVIRLGTHKNTDSRKQVFLTKFLPLRC